MRSTALFYNRENIERVGKEEEQPEINQNITERGGGVKEDMSGVCKSDGVGNVKRYVWLSFAEADYG